MGLHPEITEAGKNLYDWILMDFHLRNWLLLVCLKTKVYAVRGPEVELAKNKGNFDQK